jgi:23S rRNA (uridine2552-2'-O)-methyltransferase
MAKRANYTGGDAGAQRAKREGYAARSVYKLDEIDRRFKLFKQGMTVLDLGACPGSWTQYALKRVGRNGLVVAVDKKTIEYALAPAVVLKADVFTLEDDVVKAATGDRTPPFDVVVSDMAPRTTGVPFSDHVASVELCERALDLAIRWLKPGGSFVCKVFQGEDEPALRARIKKSFGRVKALKPDGTRKQSVEHFLVGTSFKG